MRTNFLVVRSLIFAALLAAGCGEGVADDQELVGVEETGSLSADLSTSVPIGSTLATTAALNLRTGPSTGYAVILVIPSGGQVKTVEFAAPSAGWYKVNYNGRVGWAYGAYLTLISSQTSGGGTPTGQAYQQMVMARAAGLAPHNRPYVFDGVQDCYGYVRQVWNAILFDGSAHGEDYSPNAYNRSRWLGVSGGLPVADYPSSNWVYFADPSVLLPGDVLSTHQGHAWGANWHGGIYAGVSNGQHRIWDNSSSANGAYNRVFYTGFHYYYRPTHQMLAGAFSVTPTSPTPAPAPAPAPTTGTWTAESATFIPYFTINVRSGPSTSSAIVATYSAGQAVHYDSYYNDGRYTWIHYRSYSGFDRYMVVREYGTAWGSFQ